MNIYEKPSLPVALIYGGRSAEHEVSLCGAKYLRSLLNSAGLDVIPVLIDRGGDWHAEINGEMRPTYPVRFCGKSGLLIDGKIIDISAAFPLLHGDGGEDGTVQGALDTAGIPYVGAEVAASALCLDKINTKILAESLGIPTVLWVVDADTQEETIILAEERLGYPMFVKPACLGSSVGAHPASDRETLVSALSDARGYGGRVLIERMLTDIREVEIAYFESEGVRLFSHPGEVNAHGFYDYNEKYSASSVAEITTEAELDSDILSKLRDYADRLARGAGLRQIGRLDFFLADGEIYFNEINTMPGFTSGSLYPKMIESAGIPPEELVLRLVADAARRRR